FRREHAFSVIKQVADDLREEGLTYSPDAHPGISRVRRGRGFEYLDPEGKKVRDPAVLARIRALAVPPAWIDVWICASPRGHMQATGRDARGRKQFRYHPRWTALRDANKYSRLIGFCRLLPRIRRSCQARSCSLTSMTAASSTRSRRRMSTTICKRRPVPTTRPRISAPGPAPSWPPSPCASSKASNRTLRQSAMS